MFSRSIYTTKASEIGSPSPGPESLYGSKDELEQELGQTEEQEQLEQEQGESEYLTMASILTVVASGQEDVEEGNTEEPSTDDQVTKEDLEVEEITEELKGDMER